MTCCQKCFWKSRPTESWRLERLLPHHSSWPCSIASRSLAGKAATCPGGVDRGSLDSESGCMLVATRFQDVAVAALPACSSQLHLAVKQLHRQLDRECRFTALGPELLSKLKSLTLHMQDL